MFSRLRRLSDLQKILAVTVLVAVVLGASVGAVVYTVGANSNAGCYATHAVIRNLNDYFELQIQRIRQGAIGNHQTPAERSKSIKGYRGVITALGQVTCR